MNFITHNQVFSLFPYSTFCDRHSIVWDPPKTSEETLAAEKYRDRGWQVDHLIDVHAMMNRPTELGVRKRRVGDSLCWKFSLDPDACDEKNLNEHLLSNISWKIKYNTFEVVVDRGPMQMRENAFRGEIVAELDNM
jgi:hypothetical protein